MTLEKLEKIASEATEGPWRFKCSYEFHEHETAEELRACENWEAGRVSLNSPTCEVLSEWASFADDSGLDIDDSNKTYLETFNPSTIKLMLAEMRAAREVYDGPYTKSEQYDQARSAVDEILKEMK